MHYTVLEAIHVVYGDNNNPVYIVPDGRYFRDAVFVQCWWLSLWETQSPVVQLSECWHAVTQQLAAFTTALFYIMFAVF